MVVVLGSLIIGWCSLFVVGCLLFVVLLMCVCCLAFVVLDAKVGVCHVFCVGSVVVVCCFLTSCVACCLLLVVYVVCRLSFICCFGDLRGGGCRSCFVVLCLLLRVRCVWFVDYVVLFVVRCVLLVVAGCFVLADVRRSLRLVCWGLVVCRSLFVVRCLLFVVRCLMCTDLCSLFGVCYVLFVVLFVVLCLFDCFRGALFGVCCVVFVCGALVDVRCELCVAI